MSCRSRITTLFIIGVFVCLGASQAYGAQPTIEYAPFGEPLTLPAGAGWCDFAVLMEPTATNQKVITFYDKLGQIRYLIASGTLKFRLTNQSSGKSIDVNASGPGRITLEPDGSLSIVGFGTSILFSAPTTTLPDGFPRLALVRGRVQLTVGSDNNILTISGLQGNAEDLCVALAQ